LIIDGADKLGKTTVVKMLSRKLNLPIIKMPDSKEFIKDGSIEKVSKFFNESLIQFQEFSFIMDRGFTSSRVYSEVFDRVANLRYIENIENILDPRIFILVGEKKEKDDLQEVNENWSDINSGFTSLAETKSYGIISTTDRSPLEICNNILENL